MAEDTTRGDWVPTFPSQRPPFAPGNREAEKRATHAAYSETKLAPLAVAIEKHLAATSPAYAESEDHARRRLARQYARLELIDRWLEKHGLVDDQGELRPVVKELPRFEKEARVLAREMGMTTRSRQELGLDLIRGQRELLELEDVQEAMSSFLGTALEYVPSARRAAFLEAIRGVLRLDGAAVELPAARRRRRRGGRRRGGRRSDRTVSDRHGTRRAGGRRRACRACRACRTVDTDRELVAR